LEVEMSKKCAPLWREARFEVKTKKTAHVWTTFGRSAAPHYNYNYNYNYNCNSRSNNNNYYCCYYYCYCYCYYYYYY